MTRINVGILPEELCDQMLVAEYRELPRIRGVLLRRIKAKKDIPCLRHFRLNEGHVLYFLNKGQYLFERWSDLCTEMKHRGMQVSLNWRRWPFIYRHQLMQEHIPEDEQAKARKVLQKRINERLKTMRRKPTWTEREKPDWAEV